MSPFVVKIIIIVVVGTLSVTMTARARAQRPTVTAATPLIVASLPERPLTDFPLVSRAVPQQLPPRRFKLAGWTLIAGGILMLLICPVAWADGEPFGAVVFATIGVGSAGAGVFFYLNQRRGGFVDDPTATVFCDWRGRRHVLLHSHLKTCKYLRSGTGGVKIASTDEPRLRPIYTGSYSISNLVKALATLEAEGRFAPPTLREADQEERRAWLAGRLRLLQESLNTALSVDLQRRLMEGPLVFPQRYRQVVNSAGLNDWYLHSERVWWSTTAN